MNYFIDCLTKKYVQFSGRARRQEFWLFVLFNFIASIIINVIAVTLIKVTGVGAFGTIYSLAVLLPGFAVLFRRLHDIGKSGWWWLIAFIPFIGAIILLVFCCLDSHPGENRFGPNPKGL